MVIVSHHVRQGRPRKRWLPLPWLLLERCVNPFLEGNTCVFGVQWGDEGKGKIVDYLAEDAQMVVRYCGGANAGHTVRIGANKYSTYLLPVGIFRPGIMNLIGNGVVVDLEAVAAFVGSLASCLPTMVASATPPAPCMTPQVSPK